MADVPALLAALRDADARVRGLAERALWRCGAAPATRDVDHLLRAGVVEMQHGQLEASIDTFSGGHPAPTEFAEGGTSAPPSSTWSASTASPPPTATRCFKRNPSHVGALSGYGNDLAPPRRARPRRSSASSRRCRESQLDSVRESVEALRALLISNASTPSDEGTVIDASGDQAAPASPTHRDLQGPSAQRRAHDVRDQVPVPVPGPARRLRGAVRDPREHEPLQGHRSSTFEWWDYVQTIPAPRVIVVHDIDEAAARRPVGEARPTSTRPSGCVGVVPTAPCATWTRCARSAFSSPRPRSRLARLRPHGGLRPARQGRRPLGQARTTLSTPTSTAW